MLSIIFPCDGWTLSWKPNQNSCPLSRGWGWPSGGGKKDLPTAIYFMDGKCLNTTSRAWMVSKGIWLCFPSNACSNTNKLTCATHLTVTLIKIETYCSLVEFKFKFSFKSSPASALWQNTVGSMQACARTNRANECTTNGLIIIICAFGVVSYLWLLNE